MATENDPVIGYGIIDTFDPLYLGKGGYGFLIRQSDRESGEELQEWFTRVVQEYPLVDNNLTFTTFYRTDTPESTISHELRTSLYHRNMLLPSSEYFGYRTFTWDTVRRDFESDKVMEEEYRLAGGAVADYEPFS